jgi:hypothetical protein
VAPGLVQLLSRWRSRPTHMRRPSSLRPLPPNLLLPVDPPGAGGASCRGPLALLGLGVGAGEEQRDTEAGLGDAV